MNFTPTGIKTTLLYIFAASKTQIYVKNNIFPNPQFYYHHNNLHFGNPNRISILSPFSKKRHRQLLFTIHCRRSCHHFRMVFRINLQECLRLRPLLERVATRYAYGVGNPLHSHQHTRHIVNDCRLVLGDKTHRKLGLYLPKLGQ